MCVNEIRRYRRSRRWRLVRYSKRKFKISRAIRRKRGQERRQLAGRKRVSQPKLGFLDRPMVR
jgi:hypothetical protein